MDDINQSDFLLLYDDMYQHVKDLHTKWTSIFQMTNECITLQNIHGKRSTQKCKIKPPPPPKKKSVR